MKILIRSIAGLALSSALAGWVRAAPAQNTIRAVSVVDREGGVDLEIQGTRPPNYTVFKLQDPPRLVVDLASADLSGVDAPIAVHKGGVLEVTTSQYQDAKSSVGRVVIAVEPGSRYEVAQRGEAVVVRVDKPSAKPAAGAKAAEPSATEPIRAAESATAKAAAEPAPATAAAEPTPSPTAPADAPAVPAAKTEAAPAVERAPAAAQTAPAGDNVVSRRVDEIRVKHPANAIVKVRAAAGRLTLFANGPVGKVEILELRDPPRLVLDLPGVTRAPREPVQAHGPFAQVRFGKQDGRVRVVLDATSAMPSYELKRVPSGLAVVTGELSARAPAAASKPPPLPRTGPTLIQEIKFSQSGGISRVELTGKAGRAVTHPDPRTVVLTLEGARLPKRLERSLDTSAFGGPITMVSSFNQTSTGRAVVVVSLRAEAADQINETPTGLAWTFSGREAKTRPEGAAASVQSSETKVAGFATEAPSYAASGAPQKRDYSGRRITLDFHDIDIRNLLRLIAEVSKKNIVVADDVQGKVTVSLRNVPWDQALDLILKTKGLDKEELGNVIRVAKFEQLAKEAEERMKAANARRPLEPLKVRLIPVNFARTKELMPRVKDMLSERGTVSEDERTNVLIVKDIPEGLVRAEGLVRNLDSETPQVLIEGRIIEATANFDRALGVQWGGTSTHGAATGNPTGLAFPSSIAVAGDAGGNYAVNLPAPIGAGSGGGIGLNFGSISGALNLALHLSALESNGIIKTISAPKVATIDNKEATIMQGNQIPYLVQTFANGVTTTTVAFLDTRLILKVTPHVTADGSVVMKIKVTNVSPNNAFQAVNGAPAVAQREAETEVLVKDGDTTVIGGVYTRKTSTVESMVPWFGKIPILGFLFRYHEVADQRTELLVFITPRVLNRNTSSVATAKQESP